LNRRPADYELSFADFMGFHKVLFNKISVNQQFFLSQRSDYLAVRVLIVIHNISKILIWKIIALKIL